MNKTLKSHLLLAVGSGISILLLIIFSILQAFDSAILKLNSQWILVAGAPLLVALVAGGYIKKFKGFGLELESKLQAPVTSLDLRVADAIMDMPGDEKGSIRTLHNLSRDEIRNIKRLSFILEKKDYYTPHAIWEYLDTLKKLEFFEIKRQDGTFVCLIPVSAFKNVGERNGDMDPTHNDRVSRFTQALKQETLATEFADVCISITVKHSDGLIGVLEILRSNNSEYATVASPEGKFIGVVSSREIERKIADDVLYTKRA